MSNTSKRSAVPTRHLLALLLMAGLFAAAVGVLCQTFRDNPWDRLGSDLLALGPAAMLAALLATVCSYLAMTGYDALALRYVEHSMPYRRFALASFVATAFGNNLGASAVVGAALRARVYSSWRIPGFAITRIIGFNLVTLTLGFAVLAGGGLLHHPARAGEALHLPAAVTVGIGSLLLASVVAYLLWAGTGKRPIGWRDWRIDRPSPRLAAAQVVLSTLEWLTMAAVLYVLLPAEGRLPFLAFAAAFSIATAAGIVSNVPGGLGVFESVLVVMIGSTTSPAGLAAALVAYRLCYYVLPLLLAAVLLVVHESRHGVGAGRAKKAAESPTVPTSQSEPTSPTPSIGIPSVLTPSVLALGVAGAGAFMLLLGDLPGAGALNLSAFTISLVGLTLLLLARGLHRRMKGAWASALALLSGVTVIAAVHGDAVLTAVAAVLSLLLLPARGAFYRGALIARPKRLIWSLAAAGLVGTAIWWQEFSGFGGAVEGPLLAASLSGDTPGAARLAMAAGAVGLLIGGRRMFEPAALEPQAADEGQMAQVSDLVARTGHCLSHLAFTGDKRFHFSPGETAFLMYQVEGRSWVVMGDPVGNPADFRELVWSFIERVDKHGGRPVFYNVRDINADLYRECGLSLAKLGEEAVVGLTEFSLAGKSRQGLRNCRNKSQKLGLTVDFVAPQDVGPLLPRLREISDAWLTHRNGKEKRFSLGAFDDEYVCRFPLIVVRQEEEIIAFATLWTSGDGREVQVDLMRRLPDGPRTVMTYLFVECILWAQANGFASFNLGMAPLSGLRTDATASFWDRIGHLLWTHGEQFYNFKGLREFKQGFNPDWQTRYVAAPGGPALPTVMMNVATLVGGGIRGVIRG